MKPNVANLPAVVGLTGGIGAGKSAVRQAFEALGVPCLDTDIVARSIHQDPGHPATQEVARAFPEWMTDDGALQRGSLQGLFSRNAAANRTLIDILKPHVLAVMHRWMSVITQFDGLMFTLRDGQGGKDLQQNGTGIATGAVLAMSD